MTLPARLPIARIPDPIPLHNHCLCPGCYWVATESSELCLRCTLEGCDHEENRHG